MMEINCYKSTRTVLHYVLFICNWGGGGGAVEFAGANLPGAEF